MKDVFENIPDGEIEWNEKGQHNVDFDKILPVEVKQFIKDFPKQPSIDDVERHINFLQIYLKKQDLYSDSQYGYDYNYYRHIVRTILELLTY